LGPEKCQKQKAEKYSKSATDLSKLDPDFALLQNSNFESHYNILHPNSKLYNDANLTTNHFVALPMLCLRLLPFTPISSTSFHHLPLQLSECLKPS